MSDQIPLPTIDLFTSELDPVGPKWYDLGIFLGISTHELDVIGKYHGSEGTQRCLIELFKCFQCRTKPVSWNDITDALTKMHNNNLADHIQHNVQTNVSSLSHLSSPRARSEEQEDEKTGSGSQMMEIGRVSDIKYIYIDKTISSEFNKISKEFTNLVVIIKQALRKKSDSIIHQLQDVLYDQCKLEPLSTEEFNFDKVFVRVRHHYCFLNYHILECLVDMFLSDEKPLQQLLVDYTNKLENFKESVMMKDLMKLIKEKRDLHSNHKIIYLKTRNFWGEVTLKKFEKLAKLIFQNLYDCAAQIRIEDGCICVSWVIPDIDTSILDTVSPDLLKVMGVIFLKIDNKVLYEGPNEGCHILESAFLQAVELGNVRAVELLLAVGCDTNIHTHTGELAITSAMKLIDSKGFGTFHLACLNGHTEVVSVLLAAGISPEVTTNSLITPLMMASWNGHSVVVSTLLTSGADPNMADDDGWTPLMAGSQNGHNEVVDLLLKAKAYPNACLTNRATAIYMASRNGHSVVVSTLLAYGADPNMAKSNGWTPLMIGSHNGHNEIVELLLNAKVYLNACLRNRATAIYMASRNGHSVVVSTLLASGADLNIATSTRWTPLMIGSQYGHNEVVDVLLKAKAYPNACLKNRATAIYMASQKGYFVVVSTLLTSGADPNMTRSDGWTPLMIGSQYGHHEVVEVLLKAKVNPNARKINGATAIYMACENGHSVVVSTLLAYGADPNMTRSDGWSPLMIGSQYGHHEVVEILLKAKVNPNACKINGATAIYMACENGHPVVVSTLLTYGADPNMTRSDGSTPLIIGSQNGHNEVVELLLKAEVNPNACNNNGATAIYLASLNGHSVVVSTLLTSDANPNIRTGVNSWTPLMIGSTKGHTEVVKKLIEHGGININYQAVAGITALHLASRYGHTDIVRILLESGADSSLVDSTNLSPVAYASLYHHHEVVKVFTECRTLVESLRSFSQ